MSRALTGTASLAMAMLLLGCGQSGAASPRHCNVPERTLAEWRSVFLTEGRSIVVERRTEKFATWRILGADGVLERTVTLVRDHPGDRKWTDQSRGCA